MAGRSRRSLPVIFWVVLGAMASPLPVLFGPPGTISSHSPLGLLPDGRSGSSGQAGGSSVAALPTSPASTVSPTPSTRGTVLRTPAGVHPAIVNPLADYAREPAPMGIADFGLPSAGPAAQAYRYSSPSFQGNAQVISMGVTASTTAFELNAVLVLERGGVNYSYWIQNGLHVAPSTRTYTIGGAYVWNFSSVGARLASGELRGANGSVLVTDTYYYIPGCNGLPGQCSTLQWPAMLQGRISATTVGGVPSVAYAYDLGAGWVTFDTVSFLHLAGANITGFTVDGFHAAPIGSGALDDAEWVWVAAGGGSTMTDINSNVSMSLGYWNGQNYQAVPSAWDFGTDTGETSSNVTEYVAAPAAMGGAPTAELAGGAGILRVLYNSTGRGTLEVSSPAVPSGTLQVDGAATPFVGGGANLTLALGTFPVALQNYSNASFSASIVSGGTTHLDLSGAGRTVFREIGLPTGTAWGVSVSGNSRTSTGSAIDFNLPNGTYGIVYRLIPGYVLNASAPVSLTPPLPRIDLHWAAYTYQVPVTETGLPDGTPWWVNASGELVRSNSTFLGIAAPNGSTPYTVGSLYEFLASPSSGSITVSFGQFSALAINFTVRPTFIEGQVNPSNATVTIDGHHVGVASGSFKFSVFPGKHNVTASAAGYASKSIRVLATAGNTSYGNLTLDALPPATNPSHGSGTTSTGSSAEWLYAGVGIAAVAILGAVIVLSRRHRRQP